MWFKRALIDNIIKIKNYLLLGIRNVRGGIELNKEQVEKVGKVEVFQNWPRSFFSAADFFFHIEGCWGNLPQNTTYPTSSTWVNP